MRALIQRVSDAQVNINGETIGRIGPGLVIFICAMQGDDATHCARLAAKISKLRIFRDEAGKMNRSLRDTGGEALIISQFTLAGDTSRGNRPGFSSAAGPEPGHSLYRQFVQEVKSLGIPTATGSFGAHMAVTLTNDGPVTLWLDL